MTDRWERRVREPDGRARRSSAPQPFGEGDLAALRRDAVAHAAGHGLSPARCTDVAIVVSELATNSVVHGGGHGTIASWTDGPCVVHEVRDAGTLGDARPGERLPPPDQAGGRGLWIVSQLCDRVERESTPEGTRTRVALGPRPETRS